ncbi:hypothetical protein MMC22_004322 [Lobaria immixta]|nr:hypothetical protein [Lobaria immixta]
MPNGTMVQRTVQEGLDETQAPPHQLAVDTQSSCLLGGDVFLQRRSPEALGMPMPMPTLADSERPDDDAGVEMGIVVLELTVVFVEPSDADAANAESEMDTDVSLVVLELTVVFVEPSDADAADAELEMDTDVSLVVLALRDPDAVDVEYLEDIIDACPRVRRLLESLQQLALSQHQVPDERGGHANIAAPFASRFA